MVWPFVHETITKIKGIMKDWIATNHLWSRKFFQIFWQDLCHLHHPILPGLPSANQTSQWKLHENPPVLHVVPFYSQKNRWCHAPSYHTRPLRDITKFNFSVRSATSNAAWTTRVPCLVMAIVHLASHRPKSDVWREQKLQRTKT